MFFKTSTIFTALVTKLQALEFPDGTFAGEKLFERVDPYDVPRLEQALKDLLNFRNRIALVILRTERFETRIEGSTIISTKIGEFLVLVCDRDYAPGKPSFFGDATRPGVLAMKDVVIDNLFGEALGVPHAVVQPVDGESIRIAESEQALAKGREGYRLFINIHMGSLRQPIGRGSR